MLMRKVTVRVDRKEIQDRKKVDGVGANNSALEVAVEVAPH
jgi:hypothetical protein